MFTSNFSYTGLGRIAICRFVYPQYRVGTMVYRALAPGAWFRDPEYTKDKAAFAKRYYEEILKPLNPQQVYKDLHEKVVGQVPVLLCYENVFNPCDWCHRRMAAEWLEKALNIEIPELVLIPSSNINQPSLF